MKKIYIAPAFMTISMQPSSLLAGTLLEYSNSNPGYGEGEGGALGKEVNFDEEEFYDTDASNRFNK